MVDFLETNQILHMDPADVKKGERIATIANVIFLAIAILLVPFTLFGTEYIFSKRFFTGWVVVSFIWVWVSLIICVVWPVVESVGVLREIGGGVLRDLGVLKKGKGKTGEGVV